MIQFFIPLIPPTKTHQQKKVRVVNGKPVFYEPQELANIRQKLTGVVAEYAPTEPLTGPIRLTTRWLYPAGNHQDGDYKTTKPDTDNMIKLFKDCMTVVGFWNDDAQVCSEITEKFWGYHPGIFVRVEQIRA